MPADEDSLQGAIAEMLVALHLSPPSQGASPTKQQLPRPHSFTCLAWIAKGLYMTGYKGGLDLALLPIHCLSHPWLFTHQSPQTQEALHTHHGQGPGCSDKPQPPDEASNLDSSEGCVTVAGHSEAESIQAAAAVYSLVPSAPNSILSLSKDCAHAKQKPLWQQRFFTQVLQKLEQVLAEARSNTAPGAVAEAPSKHQPQHSNASAQHEQLQDSSGSPQHEHLLLALANLVQGTPIHIVKTALPRLLGWLLQALHVLQRPQHNRGPALLLAVLGAVESMLQDPAGLSTAPQT